MEDITQRKRREEAHKEGAPKADASNRAEDEFLAVISHELRTPLSGVIGLLQLLQTTSMSAEQHDYVDLALRSADRLTHLLTDLLALSMSGAGKLKVHPAEFSMHQLCNSVEELFLAIAREKAIALEFNLDPRLPQTLIGDELRIRHILFNIVGNALKFTEVGGVVVQVGFATSTVEHNPRVRFSVCDTGIGIPSDRLADLARPFMQVDNSFTREHEGAGLGLAVVHRLVQLMNGEISVDSAVGEGTKVSVDLPLESPSSQRPRENDADTVPMNELSEGRRILVVEDDRLNQIAMQKQLEAIGHRVEVVADGQQALAQLALDEFDCILMDIQMPVMNGVEAAKSIRAASALRDKQSIPIIAVTAYAGEEYRDQFLEAGMDAYLAKPVDRQDLNAVLAQVLLDSGRGSR